MPASSSKHARKPEQYLPWEYPVDDEPADPKLRALVARLQDPKLHAEIDRRMSARAEKDGREHDRILARSWELARNIVIYR